ncbi:AT-rich interactive domain-containing 2-like isoform X1 [Brachionus plicatilis]|uniref:AT-rich interactive domain-containing 2-like isoform X1 n=1 Tax=Brachionus plicatilis TaxID=10195 RepID=A0A3M7R3A6_BRAPC|nr:AT-rich interactive domain-containing 2-like isoform X1 [Brachionus plicatilis]
MDNQNVSNENRPMYEPPLAKSADNEIKFKKLKNKEDFYNRLIEFHRHKNVNTPLVTFPTLNGKLIDLKKLYNIVISFGGWERVCEKDKWNDVGLELDSKLFKSCLNGGHALKTIYIRYLSMYEKFDHQMSYGASVSQGASLSSLLDPLHNFNHSLPHSMSVNVISSISGQIDRPSLGYHKHSVPNLDDTHDPDMNRRRFSYLIDFTPMNYSYCQHSATAGPTSSHLSPNPYEKLEISLISGLPNEVDFVFNSMVLMSSEESNSFKIYQSPRLISLILAHVGFFGQKDKYNLRPLYEHYWFRPTRSDTMDAQELFEKFLSNTDWKLLSEKYEKWTCETYARRDFGKFWHHLVQIPEEDFGQSEILGSILPGQDLGEKNESILNLSEIRHDLSDPLVPFSVEYKRIEQVLVILNNLSFEEINADFMTKCQVLFEFLCVCLYCSNPVYEIRKHALDILANISRKLKLRFLSDRHKRMLLNAMYHLIVGQEEINYSTFESRIVPILDRFELIRGLEILTKLCAQEQLESLADEDFLNNEKVLCKFSVQFKNGQNVLLLERVILRIQEMLPVQDLLILLHSLEFMYNISQFNEFICNLIMDCSQDKLISVLVNLLTLDMSHFDVSGNSDDQIKMYKIMPSSGQVISVAPVQQNANQIPQISVQSQNSQKTPSLLQQTLNNQQFNNSIAKPSLAQNLPIRIQPLINSEQQARTILRNWLLTCFQKDPNSELSKTQLYPYYQQISKYNNWPILTIPVFFEILNTTFPHLRYDEETNKLHGLKLVLNLKQQLELKEKFASIRSEPIPPGTQHPKINMSESSEHKASEENYSSQMSLSSPPTVSINMPSIGMPLLTPPPPMESSDQSEKNILANETYKANTNSCKLKETLNAGDTEMMGQNEDSTMSNSSSSTSGIQ